MLIEQIFELRGFGPRAVTPITGYFHDKTIISNENLRVDCYLLQKSKVESRTQGSRPRPRTQKNFEAKDRPSRGRGQGPRTQTQVFSKKKDLQIFFQAKKVFKNFFSGDLYLRKPKKGLCRFSARFLAFSNEILKVQK